MNPHSFSRREILRSLVGGSMLMPALLSELMADSGDPLASKQGHFPTKAKRVIFIFSNGGVSHMDTFDHKPKLFAADGKKTGVGGGLSNQQCGMLDDTLVVWTTEFGRTPGVDGTKGRGHHSAYFSSWMAGAGVKPGLCYGATDEIGATVAENKVHVHDLHATIVHLLGINHERLTYRHGGRDYRLTDVFGKVVKDILA